MIGRRYSVGLAVLLVLPTIATAQAQPKQPDSAMGRWAVLIGVDDYAELGKLRFAGNDQRALAEQLVASGFSQDQVFLMHDKATENKYRPFRENIEKQLDLVLTMVRPSDLVIVGFSGHGVQLDGKSYLCPVDARLDKLSSTCIPLDGVYDRVNKSKASLKLLVVDACRNDVVPAGRRSVALSRSVGEFDATKDVPPVGILLLNSCGPGQVSMEDEQFSHGVFMHFVLDGLRGKAANAEGSVSLAGLYDYASLATAKYVARKFNEYQTPALKGEMSGPFEIGSIAATHSTGVSPSRPPDTTITGRSAPMNELRPVPDALKQDLAALQGTWEAAYRDQKGAIIKRLTKRVYGTKERVTRWGHTGELLSDGENDFTLELRGSDRIFRVFKDKTFIWEYTYRIEGDHFIEKTSDYTLIWSRKREQ